MVVFTTTGSPTIHVYRVEDGEKQWLFEGTRAGAIPRIEDDSVYVGGQDRCYALDLKSGTDRWTVAPTAGSPNFDSSLGGCSKSNAQSSDCPT